MGPVLAGRRAELPDEVGTRSQDGPPHGHPQRVRSSGGQSKHKLSKLIRRKFI